MLFRFLGTKLLGLAHGWWLLIAAGALVAGWVWLDAREAADDRGNQQIGASQQREGDLVRTIERTEQANDARQEIESGLGDADGDAVVYDQCLRTARTPQNCERFLPRVPPDQR